MGSHALHEEIGEELAGWRKLLGMAREMMVVMSNIMKENDDDDADEEEQRARAALKAPYHAAQEQAKILELATEELDRLLGSGKSDEAKRESFQAIRDRLHIHIAPIY
jgi:hypothetical protein